MAPDRLTALASIYSKLRIAVVGDFCLDRYLEIDPSKNETSIETGLAVYNVVNVRSQPGGAGTILNNLVALGIGEIIPIGFAGLDGEGYELLNSLQRLEGVNTGNFLQVAQRRTFTYCKPLLMEKGRAPIELNRLDSKNWTATPEDLQDSLRQQVALVANKVDAIILLDQVDLADTGVVTKRLLEEISELVARHPQLLMIADSRRGLKGYPSVCLKMNRAEFLRLTGRSEPISIDEIAEGAKVLAPRHGRPVFITLAEKGIIGATPAGETLHLPALPLRSEIDIVGAGDAVTANLTAALAARTTWFETLKISMLASSIVIHKLGTTGTATLREMAELAAANNKDRQ